MSPQILPNEVFINQKVFLINGKPRVYQVLDIEKNILFELTENKQYNLWQLFFQSKKPFTMEFEYNGNQFKFIKKSKLSSDMLGIFDKNNNLIALIKKDFLKDIEIFDKDEKNLYTIKSTYAKRNFKIEKSNQEIASISKEFAGLAKEIFTDSDNFCIKLPDNISLEVQMVFIATSIFIDCLYYDD